MQARKSSAQYALGLQVVLAAALVALTPHGWAQTQPAEARNGAGKPVVGSTLERVRARGKLVLGYYADARPMSYQNASGDAAGYSVTLCQKVADDVRAKLGLPKLALEWMPLTPATGMQSVQQAKVDLLCGAETSSLANRTNVSFSIPIFPGGISAMLRADASTALRNALNERPASYRPIWRASPFSPLQHRTLSVVAGTPAVDWAKDRASKLVGLVATLDTVDSYDAGVAKLISRDSDVLFGDRAILLSLARHSTESRKLRVLPRHFTYEPLALALARNDDDFRLVVDRALSRFYASPKFGEAYADAFGLPDAETVEYFRGLPK